MTSMRKSIEDLLGELIAEVKNLHATSTEMAGHLRSGIVNDLLAVETTTFDTTGVISRDYPASFGSVRVVNEAASNVVTVSADPPQSSAPGGRGAYRVPGGKAETIGLHGRALTLYGTSGDKVSFQVFTRVWPPA